MANLSITKLETHPTGNINVNATINSNWQKIENLVDPTHTGDQAGLIAAIAQASGGVTSLTSVGSPVGAISVNLSDTRLVQEWVYSAAVLSHVFTIVGGNGVMKIIVIKNDAAGALALTWPAGAIWAGPVIGSVQPGERVVVQAFKTAVGLYLCPFRDTSSSGVSTITGQVFLSLPKATFYMPIAADTLIGFYDIGSKIVVVKNTSGVLINLTYETRVVSGPGYILGGTLTWIGPAKTTLAAGEIAVFVIARGLEADTTIYQIAAPGGGGGGGTVTAVTVATANGVSATVANQGTTPALTVSLGAITPASVASSGLVSATTLRLTPVAAAATQIVMFDNGGNAAARGWGLRTNSGTWGNFQVTESATQGGDPMAGTARVTILTGGNVGINTTSPICSLNVGVSGIALPASFMVSAICSSFSGGNIAGGKETLTISNAVDPGVTLTGPSLSFKSAPYGAGGSYSTGRIFSYFETSGGSNLGYSSGILALQYPTADNVFATALAVRNGNIGVGTTAPVAKLHVVGSIKAGTGVSATGAQLMANSSNGSAAGVQLYQDGVESWILSSIAGSSRLGISASGAERVTILSAGNVGIGTTAPGLKVHVEGAIGFPATSGSSQTGVLRLHGTGSNGVLDFSVNGGSGASIQATNQAALSANYVLSLNPNGGNVGIGTTSPGAKLDVVGDIRASTHLTTTALTVGTLSPGAVNGSISYVTDSTLPYVGANVGTAVVAGGGNHCPVKKVNGTWVIG